MPETRAIPLHSIIVPTHRLRKLRPDKVDALAQSMTDQGLLQPIVVRPDKGNVIRWLLVGTVLRQQRNVTGSKSTAPC
jgi:ParB-like chromosome segregation protein Spo0J